MLEHTRIFSWDEYVKAVDEAADYAPNKRSAFYEVSNAKARKLLHEGWLDIQADVEKLANRISETLLLDRALQDGFQATWDVYGGEVDVAAYLAGTPECMIESEPIRIAKAGRAIRLIVQINYLAEVEVDQARRRGIAVVALVEALLRCQHPVEVWAVSHCTKAIGKTDGETVLLATCVQRADETIDRGRLCFAVGHIGNFRRLTFGQRVHQFPQFFRPTGGIGKTVPISTALLDLLPEHQGAEIVLQRMEHRDKWDEAFAINWIEDQLDCIFGE